MKEPNQEIAKSKDSEVMVGGPGLETNETGEKKEEESPKLVTMKIAGKEYQVPPEEAERHNLLAQEFDRLHQKQGAELADLRKVKQRLDDINQAQSAKAQPNMDTLLFENPTEALRLWKQEVVNELTIKYEQEKRQQEFWRDFYKRHKDLDGDEIVIRAVANQHSATLNTITDPVELADKVADLSRREILRIANRAKSDAPEKTRAVIEGKSIESPKPKPATQKEESWSLSREIRERRKARGEPAQSKGEK